MPQATTFTQGSAFFDGVRQEVNSIFPMFIPDVYHIIQMRHRGIITEIEYFKLMAKQGYSDFRASQLFEVSKQIPSIQDQVRFVVKEAYTPQIIADLTANEPTPEEFIKQMQRIGVEQGQAEKYWIAHYDPLGRGEFEEMFHRLSADALKHKSKTLQKLGLEAKNVLFDLPFLKRMYRIRDVYPGLRDRLALLSYKPITRIDVRRLEDFGFLTKEELVFRNTEIGYAPEDAELLAKWTLINNALADIRPALKNVEMSFDAAVQQLIAVGATPNDAKRIINRLKPALKAARVASEKTITKAEYIKAYKIKMLTKDETIKRLVALNYDKDEAEFIIKLADLELDLKKKGKGDAGKNLTKSDLATAFKLGEIAESEFRNELQDLGYDSKEINVIVNTARAQMEKSAAK